MKFKYQINQDEQNNDDNNKLKALRLRSIQGKLGCKFSSLNNKQVQLYYQKQALIKLNELFIQLYEQNSPNPYLDFIYKFLDENNTIFSFQKDSLLSLLSAVDFITSLNNIDVYSLSALSLNQKIQEQFCKSKERPKEIVVKKYIITDIVDKFKNNNITENEGIFVHKYEIWHEQIIYLNQLYMLTLLKEMINFYHKRLLKEQKSKMQLIAMINLDELIIIARKDISEDYFLTFMRDNDGFLKI